MHGVEAQVEFSWGATEVKPPGVLVIADVEALAALLVALGRFAIVNRGRFRALDLNPIIVGKSGVVAVDIAIEPIMADAADVIANAAE